MCLLVLYSNSAWLDPVRLAKLNERIDHARVSSQPVAFVKEQDDRGFSQIGLRVGRYEPIFKSDKSLPDGLIDFIVSNAAQKVSLSGIGKTTQFEQLKSLLNRAGLRTEIDETAVLP